MSLTKVILILIAAGIVIFIALLYYTLSDRVKDVSEDEPYKQWINKPLVLDREVWLTKNKPALSKFAPNLLVEPADELFDALTLLYKLPAGSKLTIHHFKSVQNGSSGFISWYAVGKISVEENKSEMDFEYDWQRGYSLLEKKYLEHQAPPWKEEK